MSKKIKQIHITGLTDKGKNDPELAEAFKTMLNVAISADKEGWKCYICMNWNRPHDYECRFCGELPGW